MVKKQENESNNDGLSFKDYVFISFILILTLIGSGFVLKKTVGVIVGHFDRISHLECETRDLKNNDELSSLFVRAHEVAKSMTDREKCIVQYVFDKSPNYPWPSEWHTRCDKYLSTNPPSAE